jgi:hypothetical protein
MVCSVKHGRNEVSVSVIWERYLKTTPDGRLCHFRAETPIYRNRHYCVQDAFNLETFEQCWRILKTNRKTCQTHSLWFIKFVEFFCTTTSFPVQFTSSLLNAFCVLQGCVSEFWVFAVGGYPYHPYQRLFFPRTDRKDVCLSQLTQHAFLFFLFFLPSFLPSFLKKFFSLKFFIC